MKKTTTVLLASTLMLALGCSKAATQFALPQQNEQFSGQTFYNNKVDLLFVVDNSKSMLQYQQRLAAKVGEMVDTLNSLGMDYRIGVTTSTMAKNSDYASARKLVGSPVYLTSANVNLLADRIIVGESGSDLERSLKAVLLCQIIKHFLRNTRRTTAIAAATHTNFLHLLLNWPARSRIDNQECN